MRGRIMRQLARWHIWLGWLVAVPLLMWTITGLVMASRPIEEVRGEHLRLAASPPPLPPGASYTVRLPAAPPKPILQAVMRMDRSEPITQITYDDGSADRLDATGALLPPLSEADARAVVAGAIKGGDNAPSARLFGPRDVPVNFRRPIAVWQVMLSDGTHVYVGHRTGSIEAIRTPFWRIFDVMRGLHIMDLRDREDTHHPLLVLFAALALLAVLIGSVLLFRRRKARTSGTAK